MKSSFAFDEYVHNLLFYGWTTHGDYEFVATCFACFLTAFSIEILKVLGRRAGIESDTSPLQYAQRPATRERPAFLNPLVIPSSVRAVKRRRLCFRLLGLVIYSVQIALAYVVMLFVMTFNAWFLIAAALGYMFGYYIFTGLNIDSRPTNEHNEPDDERWADRVNS